MPNSWLLYLAKHGVDCDYLLETLTKVVLSAGLARVLEDVGSCIWAVKLTSSHLCCALIMHELKPAEITKYFARNI